jgi:transposase-like protein
MRKSYRKSGSSRKSRGSLERKKRRQEVRRELPVQLPLDREELATMVQEALHSFAVEAGVLLAAKLLEDEVTQLCGPRYQWQSGRTWNRYGRQPGQITLAGQKVRIGRPRVRRTRGKGEARLPIYGLLQREEAMPEAVLQRMVRGVSCRDYEGVVEHAREGFGVEKSSVSRHFVKASAAAVKELAQRRWDGVRFPAIFIDGK